MKKNRKPIILILILLVAAFLRFYNLMHDSPYFFNPDERNMAGAVTQLRLPNKITEIPHCLISELSPHNLQPTTHILQPDCNLNPHFFAYGQFPLYLSFVSDQITKPLANIFIHQLTTDNRSLTTSFPSAIFWLRFWSALTSTFTVLLVYLITKKLLYKSQIPSTKFQTNPKFQAPSSKQTGKFKYLKFKILNLFGNWELGIGYYAAIFAAFSPGLIQAAHFGTTESLLTFFFMTSIYLSIKLLSLSDLSRLSYLSNIILLSLTIGLALGSKLTGLFCLVPPGAATLILIIKSISLKKKKMVKSLRTCLKSSGNMSSRGQSDWPWRSLPCRQGSKLRLFKHALKSVSSRVLIGLLILFGSLIVYAISSPYNLVDPQDFQSAVFGYERDVAYGRYEAFYTRQYVNTTPIIFQAEKIFPYALGWPIFILGSLGFIITVVILIINLVKNFQFFSQRLIRLWWTIFPASAGFRKRRDNFQSKFKLKIFKFNKNFKFQISNYTKNTKRNELLLFIITVSFLIYFIPNAFLFAKWTRFMTPILPFFAVFSVFALLRIYSIFSVIRSKFSIFNFQFSINAKNLKINKFKNSLGYCLPAGKAGIIGLLVIASVLPGLMFMSIYTHEDSRVTASRWIWQNIPDQSYLLFETANVIDIPLGIPNEKLPDKSFTMNSFDYYHLDDNKEIFSQLLSTMEKADYIFIPSRRIFVNYLRLPERYPLTTKYYQLLFSGALGFEKVAEFSSFPKLEIGNWKLEIDDERSEESYTVFDHPVIRIYKKVRPLTTEEYRLLFET